MSLSLPFATFLLCASLPTMAQANALAVPSAGKEELNNRVQKLLTKVKSSLREIGGGTFHMGDWGTESGGSWDTETHSRPVHKVTLNTFSMMAYKVTYEDFDVFTDATGQARVDMDQFAVRHRAPRRPAGVSWHGAKAYCQWLAAQTGLAFDLPTEAQWEYSARSGGKRVLYSTDNGKIERGRNFPPERKHGEARPPLPDVGTYPPNPAGLFGMSENTREWVDDWYDENYYAISPERNPSGPKTGTKKVKRGSVGGAAESAAMVFMRTSAIPQPLDETYPTGLAMDSPVMVPFPGFSSYYLDNFRCAVNSAPNRN